MNKNLLESHSHKILAFSIFPYTLGGNFSFRYKNSTVIHYPSYSLTSALWWCHNLSHPLSCASWWYHDLSHPLTMLHRDVRFMVMSWSESPSYKCFMVMSQSESPSHKHLWWCHDLSHLLTDVSFFVFVIIIFYHTSVKTLPWLLNIYKRWNVKFKTDYSLIIDNNKQMIKRI